MIYKFNDLFNVIRYPAGEPHVRFYSKDMNALQLMGKDINNRVLCEARNFDDLAIISLAANILQKFGIQGTQWLIPYFPFGRHDRRNDQFDSQPLSLAMQMVAHLNVVTIDPHSDVSGQLPHYSQSDVVRLYQDNGFFYPNKNGSVIVAIPDAGAIKKTYTWLGARDSVQCLKKRNTATGKLSGFEVLSGESFDGRPVVIVDDICDGGGTFLGLAKELLARDAGELRLAITHGLFTHGLDELFNLFSSIWTLDTCTIADTRLTMVPVTDLIYRAHII